LQIYTFFLYLQLQMSCTSIRVAVVGVGNRAHKYLSCLPEDVTVTCLVEPDPLRLQQAAEAFGVPPEGCFSRTEDFFAAPRPVDAVIITAPDRMHVPLTLAALRSGYPVLLEKPAALSMPEYQLLIDAEKETGIRVGLCLPMRYHPCFSRIRDIVLSGELGALQAIEHTEYVGLDRMCHTFVRGGWSRREEAGPIFLSKCSHDADFLLSLTGGKVLSVRSQGSLMRYRKESAPGEAATRCINCPLQRSCRFSAVDLYLRRKEWVSGFDIPDGSTLEAVIKEELLKGRYGRCVYHCDNNVFDYQKVSVELDRPVSLSMTLDGLADKEGREMHIRGTEGTLDLIGETLTIRSGKAVRQEDFPALAGAPLHAGADRRILEDFFASLRENRPMEASLDGSLEAHRLCFLAD
jgi:predicted dehydrogenase